MLLAKILYHPKYLIPLFIGLLSKVMIWSYLRTLGCAGWDPHCLVRWDSGLYLDIAVNGTTLFPCDWGDGKLWCGNAGWAPLYSWLIRIFRYLTGGSIEYCGVWISTFFYMGYLILAAQLVRIENFGIKNWLILLLFAFCPGFIYFHAVFPISQTLFFILLTVYGLKTHKYWMSGLGAVACFFSYSSGIFIIIPLCLTGLVKLIRDRNDFTRFFKYLIVPILLGVFIFHLYYYIKTGHWNAIYLVQAKYEHGLYFPWEMLHSHWRSFLGNYSNPKGLIEIQAFTVSILTIFLLIDLGLKIWRGNKSDLVYFYIGFLLAFWWLPFNLGPEISLYRSCALLGLVQVLWAKKDVQFIGLLLVIYFIFSIPMISWFFDKTMI